MAFNSEQQYAVLKKVGYTGPLDRVSMEDFMGSKPGAASLVLKLEKKAQEMKTLNKGGYVSSLAEGGSVSDTGNIFKGTVAAPVSSNLKPEADQDIKDEFDATAETISTTNTVGKDNVTSATSGTKPKAAKTTVASTKDEVDAALDGTPGPMTYKDGAPSLDDFIKGNVAGEVFASDRYDDIGPMRAGENPDTFRQDRAVAQKEKAQADYNKKYGIAGKTGAGLKPAEGKVSDDAKVTAAETTESSVSDLEAATGESIDVEKVDKRVLDIKETVDPVADAASAAKFTEEIEAATATPSEKATVKGQLGELMADFEGEKTPAWAAGAMRAATTAMAQRGLGSSSMAGQAIIQAAMESALPIAMADAQTQASFEAQNLSNKQQRAMLGAQQRAAFIGQEFDQKFQARVINASKVSDIANMNFTAEQQVALENSRNANSMNMANLNNKQAMVMAEAAALSNLDIANLSNRQQAAVQNAKSFLDMDMANLNNEQQTNMFKAQARQQAILTDTAARNAASQFNATSENQTNQFFADLQANVSKFNADQKNGIAKFDANAVNATRQFNTAQNNSFKQFNTSNSLVVAQANAAWRQNIASTNNKTANEKAMYVAKEKNKLSTAALDEIWQRERDVIDYAFTAYESDQDRSNAIILEKLTANNTLDAAKFKAELDADSKISSWLLKLVTLGKGNIFS